MSYIVLFAFISVVPLGYWMEEKRKKMKRETLERLYREFYDNYDSISKRYKRD